MKTQKEGLGDLFRKKLGTGNRIHILCTDIKKSNLSVAIVSLYSRKTFQKFLFLSKLVDFSCFIRLF